MSTSLKAWFQRHIWGIKKSSDPKTEETNLRNAQDYKQPKTGQTSLCVTLDKVPASAVNMIKSDTNLKMAPPKPPRAADRINSFNHYDGTRKEHYKSCKVCEPARGLTPLNCILKDSVSSVKGRKVMSSSNVLTPGMWTWVGILRESNVWQIKINNLNIYKTVKLVTPTDKSISFNLNIENNVK